MKLTATILSLACMAIFSGCQSTQGKPLSQDYMSGPCIEVQDSAAYDQAIETIASGQLKKSRADAPDYMIGVAYYCMGQLVKAERELTSILQSSPGDYDALMLRSRVYFDKDQTAKGLSDLEAAALANPARIEPLMERARYHMAADMPGKAIDDLVLAIKRDPRSAAAYASLADVNALVGKFDEALTFYDRALRFAPDHANAYAGRGLLHFELGNYENAERDLARASGMSSNAAIRLALTLGYSRFHLGKYALAAKSFTLAIDSDPLPSTDLLTMRAMALFNTGKSKEAMEDMDRAISQAPDDSRLYYNRAGFLSRMDRQDMALADYNTAIILDPDYYEALINRGRYYFDTGKYYRALIDYNKAVEVEPERAQSYVHRGAAHMAAEMYWNAEEDFTTAMEIDPALTDIAIALAELCTLRQDFKGACSWLSKASLMGYSKWGYVRKSPALSTLRGRECYSEIVP